MMKEDPENRMRCEHKWDWHNRGNVWHKMATCWAGKEDWMITRKKQNSPEEKYNTDKQKTKIKKRGLRKRHPGIWDPKTSQFTLMMKDLQYNNAETVMWHASGSTANLPRSKVQRDNWQDSKTLTLMVEEGSCQADLEYRQLREPRLRVT